MLRVEFWTHLDPLTLEAIGEGLVRQNVVILSRARALGLAVPRLYQSGIVYRRDPPGLELFRSAARVHQLTPSWCLRPSCARCRAGNLCGPLLRWGDCDDLAGLDAAERRVYDGVDAQFAVAETDNVNTLHAVVRLPDGRIVDPTYIVRRLRP